MEGFLRHGFEGLTFGEAYTRRGSFSEFYGIWKVNESSINIRSIG